MVIYPTFQLTAYTVRVPFNDTVYRPVEEAAIGWFFEQEVVLVPRSMSFDIPDPIFEFLSDTESWVSQVCRHLDKTGGCNAWIQARQSIGYTRNPALITEELNRPSYKLSFQVTPGLVIEAQKLKRQRSG